MLNHTTYTVDGRTIHVFDGLFTKAEAEAIYVSICQLQFRVANVNFLDVQGIQDKHLKADVDVSFLDSIKLFGGSRDEIISPLFGEDFYMHKAYVNLGIKGDAHKCHVDAYHEGQGKTILYYANRDWDQNHGGETIFYNMEQTEIAFVSSYKPGRLVIFDSDLPHSARPQTFDGPAYRFTLALKYLRDVAS